MRQFCSAEALLPGIVLNDAIKPRGKQLNQVMTSPKFSIYLKHNASWDTIHSSSVFEPTVVQLGDLPETSY